MGRPKGTKDKRYDTDPNDTSMNIKFLFNLTRWKNTAKVDLHDPDQLMTRIEDFFEMCIQEGHKPTLTDLGIALDIPREYIYMIVSGNYYGHVHIERMPKECVQAVKDAYNIIKGNVESMIVNGQINPVAGIFLAKNMGIKDTNDMFDAQTQKEKVDVERLKTQYLHQLPDKEKGD